MKKEDIAWGLASQTRIAQKYADTLGGYVVGLPTFALVDFLVFRDGVVIAAVEVKRRRIRSDAFATALMPASKIRAAELLRESLDISTVAVVEYTDRTVVYDLDDSEALGEERFISRMDRPGTAPIRHFELKKGKAL